MDEPLIPTAKIVRRKYRKGTFISRFFRHIFEHKRVGKMFGAGLSVIAFIFSYFPPNHVSLAQESYESTVVETEINLKTLKGIQYPVQDIKITQRFSFFHPGIDLDGVTGDSVKPIKAGKVTGVEHSKFAYGNSVIVNHGNQLESRYAHLSEIEVKEGQEIDTETEIGKMGATGRAFGDHLHLEVYDHGRAINPLTVLSR